MYVSWDAIGCGQETELVTEIVTRCWKFRYVHQDQGDKSRFLYEGVGFGMSAQDAATDMQRYINADWALGIEIVKASVIQEVSVTHLLPVMRGKDGGITT